VGPKVTSLEVADAATQGLKPLTARLDFRKIVKTYSWERKSAQMKATKCRFAPNKVGMVLADKALVAQS